MLSDLDSGELKGNQMGNLLDVEQVDMTMDEELIISDVEDGEEADGIEILANRNRRERKKSQKDERIANICKRATTAKQLQQQTLCESFMHASDGTTTSLRRAAAKAEELMDEDSTEDHHSNRDASDRMDLSPPKDRAPPANKTTENTTRPNKIVIPEEGGIHHIQVPTSSTSTTTSTNATAASTISSMTSSTLKPTTYAGVRHGKIEPNEISTEKEGRDNFEMKKTRGTDQGSGY